MLRWITWVLGITASLFSIAIVVGFIENGHFAKTEIVILTSGLWIVVGFLVSVIDSLETSSVKDQDLQTHIGYIPLDSIDLPHEFDGNMFNRSVNRVVLPPIELENQVYKTPIIKSWDMLNAHNDPTVDFDFELHFPPHQAFIDPNTFEVSSLLEEDDFDDMSNNSKFNF
jgi:hypothetical protein